MKLVDTRPVAIAEIFDRNRLRPIDPAWAEALAQQIAETGGLRTPVEVRALKPNGFALIAGGHRLAAAKLLGWDEVPAQIYEATADEARLREVDENLIRHELNPLDRGAFLLERKALYLKLHPETAQHVAGGKARHGVSSSDIVSFAANTAEKLGWNAKTIERAVSIAANLSAESKARLAGTGLARNQAELLALAKLGPSEQARALDVFFDAAAGLPNLRAAIAKLADRPVKETDHAARLTTTWMHADADARKAFLAFLKHWQGGPARLGWRLEEIPAPKPDLVDQAGSALAFALLVSDEDVQVAKNRGWADCQDNVPRTANPYTGARRADQQLAAAWLEGWDEAAVDDQGDTQEEEEQAA